MRSRATCSLEGQEGLASANTVNSFHREEKESLLANSGIPEEGEKGGRGREGPRGRSSRSEEKKR